jgi:hypothetical protein
MVQGLDEAMEWDWAVLERRRRGAYRLARWIGITGGIALVSGLVGLIIAPIDYVVAASVFILGFILLVAALLSILAGNYVFLLDPWRYLSWLRELGPYEPATFWEQTGHHITSRIGGAGVLVLSAVIGAIVGSQTNMSQTIADAWTLIGWLLMIGIPLWWAGFLARLASHHSRAIKRGALPTRQANERWQLLLLFVAYWAVGVVGMCTVSWIAPRYLEAMYGIKVA